MSALPRGPLMLLLGALALGAAACASDSGDTIEVRSTDTRCVPERTTFDAGELTFEIVNEGSKPTELYVYGANDEVISEVENVGPGTSRTLTVNLGAGDYQLGCKPGQTGEGIRADITVKGSGAAEGTTKPADRDVELTALDYSFTLPDPAIKAGETIQFVMTNRGVENHNFQVLDSRGRVYGEIPSIETGAVGRVTITFDAPGAYRYICDVDDHLTRGMSSSFTVAPA
jgi:plastocyanin